jgi:hypothetical protein
MKTNQVRNTALFAFIIAVMGACSGSSDRPPQGALQGLRTIVYGVPNVDEAKHWHTQALGIEPYFAEGFYVGFNIGGYELALDPSRPAARPQGSGVMAYWGVDDVQAELERLLGLGARPHSPFQHVGGGIKEGSILDPYGNAIGLIYDPNFEAFD